MAFSKCACSRSADILGDGRGTFTWVHHTNQCLKACCCIDPAATLPWVVVKLGANLVFAMSVRKGQHGYGQRVGIPPLLYRGDVADLHHALLW